MEEQHTYQNIKHQYLASMQKVKNSEKHEVKIHKNTDEQTMMLHDALDDELEFQEEFCQHVYLSAVQKMLLAHKENLTTASEMLHQNLKLFESIKPAHPKRKYSLSDGTDHQQKVFGEPLNETTVKVIDDFISLLEKYDAPNTEGIFRQAGDVIAINRAKQMYDSGRGSYEALDKMLQRKVINVHGIASLLKSLLRDLPDVSVIVVVTNFIATVNVGLVR
jgi:hypothetical protein